MPPPQHYAAAAMPLCAAAADNSNETPPLPCWPAAAREVVNPESRRCHQELPLLTITVM